jgi:hypothetical protein
MGFDLTLMQQNYNLPAELVNQLQGLSATNFADNFGESFSRLSLKGFTFSLVSGSSVTALGDKPLTVVFLGDDPKGNYLTYYAGVYSQTAENIKPDAVWYASDPTPTVVPPSVMEKDPRTGKYGYSRKQRTVIAILDNTGNITPVVFDINAVSMFGDNCNLGGVTALSYSNYRRFLSKAGVLPCCIATQIVLDRSGGIPAVKFIPAMNANGTVQLLPNDVLQKVVSVATSSEVADLLKVNTLPEDPLAAQAPVASAPQPAPIAPAPQPAPVISPADSVLDDANKLLQQVSDINKGAELSDLIAGAQKAIDELQPTAPAPQPAPQPAPVAPAVNPATASPSEPVLTTSADLAALLTAAKS